MELTFVNRRRHSVKKLTALIPACNINSKLNLQIDFNSPSLSFLIIERKFLFSLQLVLMLFNAVK